MKSRTGCSRPAILKFMREKYEIGDEKKATTNLRLALKRGIENGSLKMSQLEGKNSHKFKLGDNAPVIKPKKVNLGAKEKKPKKKVAKTASKGKTAGVKKTAKVNKGKVLKKSTTTKRSTLTKKSTSKSAKTSRAKSAVKGAKKVAKKPSKK